MNAYGFTSDEPIKVLALGDSLTAGWGLSPGQSLPDRLEEMARRDGLNVRMINAGVSGDTSGGGMQRLSWNLAENPDAAMVELGANDALQGKSPETMRQNLETILSRLEQRSIPTLLIGMYAPRNLGESYAQRYDGVFPELAERFNVLYYPFILEGVHGNPQLTLPDGLHPNEEGVRVMARNIYPFLKQLVEQVMQQR